MVVADDCPFDGVTPATNRSVRVATPPPKSESELDRVANTPLESLAFKDFAKLKSGRDSFSGMKLPQLQDALSVADWRSIVAAFQDDDSAKASCCRWILRGLDCDKAIRKVRTDLEISEKATAKWKN
jgi:hypothetical protein